MFQEYQAAAEKEKQFHFISVINAIYYLGDLEVVLMGLYDRLASGGILLMTLIAGMRILNVPIVSFKKAVT